MSIRNIPGGEGSQECKADNFTAKCEQILYKTWEPRRLTKKWAPTVSYRDGFAFFILTTYDTQPKKNVTNIEMHIVICEGIYVGVLFYFK
jgi:hypothetical protein